MRLLKWTAIILMVGTVGCGLIGDKDRIKIAKIKDTYITRGDLFRIIREMPDEERPIIRNKGDLLRVLNNYIDDQIKGPIADAVNQEFEARGKTLVPRDMAKKQFFEQNKDSDYESMYQVSDPAVLGMSPAQFDGFKQEVDSRIDRIHAKLKGEAAVIVRAMEAFKNKEFEIDPAEYEREYKLRKDELKNLEWLAFRSIRFDANFPGSESEAASVRKRLDGGESFESVMKDYAARSPSYVVESEIENNPALEKFRGFWLNASESKKGDIIGPVYLPQYQVMGGRDAQGRSTVKNMPEAYLVLQVVDHKPETTLTIEQAKSALTPHILVSKYMRQLREENGVEIYENKLPDPGIFSDQNAGKPLA